MDEYNNVSKFHTSKLFLSTTYIAIYRYKNEILMKTSIYRKHKFAITMLHIRGENSVRISRTIDALKSISLQLIRD